MHRDTQLLLQPQSEKSFKSTVDVLDSALLQLSINITSNAKNEENSDSIIQVNNRILCVHALSILLNAPNPGIKLGSSPAL